VADESCSHLTSRMLGTSGGPVWIQGYPCDETPAPHGPGECVGHLDEKSWGAQLSDAQASSPSSASGRQCEHAATPSPSAFSA
jgi:hypothetical protein